MRVGALTEQRRVFVSKYLASLLLDLNHLHSISICSRGTTSTVTIASESEGKISTKVLLDWTLRDSSNLDSTLAFSRSPRALFSK